MNEENEQRGNVRSARRQQQKQASRMRMMKIGTAVAVVLLLVGAGTGLYLHSRNNASENSVAKTSETTQSSTASTTASSETEATQESSEATEPSGAISEQLQAVVADYSKKIEDKTPVLIEEYQAEIQNNQDGVNGLSVIANRKARELQALSDEGISKLRGMYQDASNKEDIDLDTMINQLSASYTAQVARISDIYLRTSAELQAATPSSESSSEETSPSTEATPETTESSESQANQYTAQSTEDTSNQANQATTTVVREGEGPNQIAQRTGVPVETILSLNGMTMDDFFFNPGQELRLN
ncbi:LysM peptidoglycan-binding domain-containing protein [Enterococcus mundtii]|uniref:LysM peptidoglycan-binding domain-containing protein n=1 Tax=Enterococcus TaxID=1350 RepID=UPI000F7D0003|nr:MULTISPECIES: LysM peptidoglycan-binding domain-containing protein [Enterococcus]AZP92135.1 peptidoglycan-binding protein LysM [Enterococcus mundtii]MDK4211822.1 LysM peptidoglycan-binding domain-containing protein [Enterococcus mundtii]MEC3941388.1 LysM peptidoglycan-binding domain-containing protein [Enterococcus mundtii]